MLSRWTVDWEIMAEEVVKKRNVNTGIYYYRYKVCSMYGHVEIYFARNQLLYNIHLTAGVLGIDVNKEGFLKKMSNTKVIAHQDKLVSIIVCRCKKKTTVQLVRTVYAERMEDCTSKCHGGRGVNALCTLCKTEEQLYVHYGKRNNSYLCIVRIEKIIIKS